MKEIISTSKAPAAIGPYSQAVRAANLLFASGQIPLNPETGEMVAGDISKQTERVLENIKAILADQGLGLNNVVKATVFLQNMEDFAAMNAVYRNYFSENPPARSAIQVARLPKDALIEIEIIAAY